MKKTSLATVALLSLLSLAPATYASDSSHDAEYREARIRDRDGFMPRLVRELLKRFGVVRPTTDLPVPPRP